MSFDVSKYDKLANQLSKTGNDISAVSNIIPENQNGLNDVKGLLVTASQALGIAATACSPPIAAATSGISCVAGILVGAGLVLVDVYKRWFKKELNVCNYWTNVGLSELDLGKFLRDGYNVQVYKIRGGTNKVCLNAGGGGQVGFGDFKPNFGDYKYWWTVALASICGDEWKEKVLENYRSGGYNLVQRIRDVVWSHANNNPVDPQTIRNGLDALFLYSKSLLYNSFLGDVARRTCLFCNALRCGEANNYLGGNNGNKVAWAETATRYDFSKIDYRIWRETEAVMLGCFICAWEGIYSFATYNDCVKFFNDEAVINKALEEIADRIDYVGVKINNQYGGNSTIRNDNQYGGGLGNIIGGLGDSLGNLNNPSELIYSEDRGQFNLIGLVSILGMLGGANMLLKK
jgi:hypothetical protein